MFNHNLKTGTIINLEIKLIIKFDETEKYLFPVKMTALLYVYLPTFMLYIFLVLILRRMFDKKL